MFTVGVFQDLVWAARGIAALLSDGFSADAITVLAKRTPEAASMIQERLGSTAEELDVERVGPVVACGRLISALDRGELESRGLAKSFGRAGFQTHDGQIYETLVSRGGVLVGVASIPRAADALAKLHSFGAGNAAIGAWAGRV